MPRLGLLALLALTTAAQDVTVSDGRTILRFSQTNGALVSMTCSARGRQLIVPEPDWWTLQLHDGTVRPSAADSFAVRRDGEATVLAWSFTARGIQAEVRLTPQPQAQGIAAQWVARSAKGSTLRVKEIFFPHFRAAASIKNVTRPFDSLDEPRSADGSSHRGLYPGNFPALQFFAAWGGGPDGFYVGAHDARGFTKTIKWDRRLMTFTFHQPDPDIARREVALPYSIVLAAFEGDWQDGVDYYRRWAHRHAPWCQRGTLADYGPEWAQRSTAWIYSLYDFPMPVEELAPRIREVFGIEGPIGVHVLGPSISDHSNMPAGELEPWMLAFQRRIIPIMRKNGYYVFEYRNSHKYTKGGPGFESAQPYACRWQGRLIEEGPYEGGAGFRPGVVPAGTPGSVLMGSPPDVFGMRTEKQKYPLIEMCMGTEFWRRKLLDIVMPCPGYGLIGNYLDQIAHNVNASRCDAVGHGHPLRGGDWYVRAHEQVLGDIIRHYRTMGVDRPLLSHESFCEPLLGLVNTSLLDWDIRVFAYLYHPYVFFESHNTYNGIKDLDTLREWLARDFHSGRMPGFDIPCDLPGVDVRAVLCNKRDPADQPALRMIRHWMRTRSAWLNYLNMGAMLHTPRPAAGSGRITASAWRDRAGTTALFFSNQTGQPQRLIFDPARYLPGRRWKAWLDNGRPIELPGGDQHVDRDLAPDQTLVFETSR